MERHRLDGRHRRIMFAVRTECLTRCVLVVICGAIGINQLQMDARADQSRNPFTDQELDIFPFPDANLLPVRNNESPPIKLRPISYVPPAAQEFGGQEPVSPLQESGPSGPSSRLYGTIPSAKKMIIRRDPPRDRIIGNDPQNRVSLRSVQEELQRNERSIAPGPSARVTSNSAWSMDVPYGKYIYIHHSPLLFEDFPLERYGDEYHPYLTPVVSLTKFMGTVPLLPYKIPMDYWAAWHDDALYSFDYRGNQRPGITEGSWIPHWYIFQE